MKSRTFGDLIFVIIMLSLSMLFGPILFPVEEPATQRETRSEFTPTLVAAYQELKRGETITGREYLGLNEMVRQAPTQLTEVAGLVGESSQEIISFLSDTEGVLVLRQKVWDGNSEHHL